jgi:hypothetical protein
MATDGVVVTTPKCDPLSRVRREIEERDPAIAPKARQAGPGAQAMADDSASAAHVAATEEISDPNVARTTQGSQATTDFPELRRPAPPAGRLASEESRRERLSALEDRGEITKDGVRLQPAQHASAGPAADDRTAESSRAVRRRQATPRSAPRKLPGRIGSRFRFARTSERLRSGAGDACLGRIAVVRASAELTPAFRGSPSVSVSTDQTPAMQETATWRALRRRSPNRGTPRSASYLTAALPR